MNHVVVKRFSVLLLFVFACNAHAKKIDVDICESTVVEYRKFSQLNIDSYRSDFKSFAAKYIYELRGCQGPQQYRFGLREILNDPRSNEQVYSMIIDYFDSTVPSEEYGRNRNVWSNEIHVMARHKPLDDKTKLKLYEMAEKHGLNIVALAYITSVLDDTSQKLYARIVDDYV
jgi:hypothetical protein